MKEKMTTIKDEARKAIDKFNTLENVASAMHIATIAGTAVLGTSAAVAAKLNAMGKVSNKTVSTLTKAVGVMGAAYTTVTIIKSGIVTFSSNAKDEYIEILESENEMLRNAVSRHTINKVLDNKLREAFSKNDADLEELDKMSEKMRRKRVMEDEIEAMLKNDDHIVHK